MSITATTTVIVPPSQNRWESLLLAATIAGLLLLTGLYTARFGRQEPMQQLLDWQISAFSDLKGVDQAIYNQMQVAAQEIGWMHFYNGTWPEIQEFEEGYLAPFYRDLGWERNGSIEWKLDARSLDDTAGITVYHGSQGNLDSQGAWLIVMNHSHAGSAQVNDTTIWRHPDADAPAPDQPNLSSLILNGWQQVIPYQGSDEVRRLNAG